MQTKPAMPGRWFLLLAGVCLLVMGVVVILLGPARHTLMGRIRHEPFYEGMPLSYWLRELRDTHRSQHSWVEELLRSPPDYSDQRVANHRTECQIALQALRSESVPALIEMLQDSDGGVRCAGADVLARIGPNAKQAVPALITMLVNDGVAAVRESVAHALGEIKSDAATVVPALTTALRDPDAYTRSVVAEALGKFGPQAEPAIPVLIQLLDDNDPSVLLWTADALGKVGPGAKAAVPHLIKLMQHGNAGVRHRAAIALGMMGGDAKEAAPGLRALLRDQDATIRDAAAQALSKVEPGGAMRNSGEDQPRE